MEVKEEPLEDVAARARFLEGVRLCECLSGRVSESDEDADLGGDGSIRGSVALDTLSNGLRVRNIGPFVSNLLCMLSFVFFGSVSAQFSHGIALFLSFSS